MTATLKTFVVMARSEVQAETAEAAAAIVLAVLQAAPDISDAHTTFAVEKPATDGDSQQ